MDTMVPCMNCGRSFCSVCAPSRGGAHYCADCHNKRIREIEEKSGSPAARRAPEKKKTKPGGPITSPENRRAPPPTLKKAVPGARQGRGGIRRILGFFLKPFKRLKDSFSNFLGAQRRRMGAQSLQKKITGNRQRRTREREKRRAVKTARHGRGREALAFRAASAREAAASYARRAAGRARKAVIAALLFVPGKLLAGSVRVYEGFPVGLVETKEQRGVPPLRKKWKTLLFITVGGIAIWVVSVLAVRDRWTLCGCLVGLAVGAGFVRALGGVMSRDTGLFAGTATVLSIIAGELIVQMLFSMHIMKDIGITERVMARAYSSWGFYANFFWWFVVGILLPSGILAFLIGAWPFPKRLYWRGFGSG
ncbi:MAG: hypothetical protein KJ907_10445 [Actinobacteria bacterium]|nr:hypothetical protein [Actinomycetota bacterium]MBU4403134.1 hypothetical protein [Actinomycetota bacterium]MBU4443193.1 hypothetical protein [Actinomycetota bacterium]